MSDGAKVLVGKDEQTPSADLAPRKKRSSRDVQKDGQAKDSQAKDGQAKDGQAKDGERRGKRGEGDQKGQTGSAPAPASAATGDAAK